MQTVYRSPLGKPSPDRREASSVCGDQGEECPSPSTPVKTTVLPLVHGKPAGFVGSEKYTWHLMKKVLRSSLGT